MNCLTTFMIITLAILPILNIEAQSIDETLQLEMASMNIHSYEPQSDNAEKMDACHCGLAGTYLAKTYNDDPNATWSDCSGSIWEGQVKIEEESPETYILYSNINGGDFIEDISMGAYEICYGAGSTLPGGDLRLVNICGLSYTGASIWGEVYSIESENYTGNELTITWSNDYNEKATTVLTRMDGMLWEDFECVQCAVAEQDSMALLALYNSTDGANWTTKWDLNEPVRNWPGVTVGVADCKITELRLRDGLEGFGLNGTIPDEIGNLADLMILDLGYNQALTGEIPSTIGNLANLERLTLYVCNLEGEIPTSIVNLNKLLYVSFTQNNLTGNIPIEIGSMNQLNTFYASFNHLTGTIPVELTNLSNLRGIGFSGNLLTGTLPEGFGNNPNLIYMFFGQNDLSGEIPESYGNFTELFFMNLAGNALTGSIPEGFGELTEMVSFDVSDNQLTGSIPSSFSNLTNLSFFKVFSNQLTGEVPASLYTSNTGLTRFYVHDNNFDGCYDLSYKETICNVTHQPSPTFTTDYNGTSYDFYDDNGYNMDKNPKLPWSGNISAWCMDEEQIGAPCDDGDALTIDDKITANCECAGILSAVEEITGLEAFQVFPNPIGQNAALQVMTELTEAKSLQLSLYNILGQAVLNESVKAAAGKQSLSLPIVGLSPGLYQLVLAENEKRAVLSVIVQ